MLASLVLVLAIAPGRDPWVWPFSRESIWNMPIGAAAVYVPAGLSPSKYASVDYERFYKLKANDPVRPIFAPSGWQTRWPGDRTKQVGSMPVPDDLMIPDARQGFTPNECSAFLMPNGRTVLQLEPTCRLERAGPIVGYPREPVDLYGDGRLGSHWGSGLSTLGGSIRLGELIGKSPIHHAIKINIWELNCYYSPSAKGFRWPADRNDNGAEKAYRGKNPSLQMGSLLALKPELTLAKLGIKTRIGEQLFRALQDYGAYISDASGWDDYDLCVEKGVVEEVKQQEGLDMSGSSGPYFDDLMKIIAALSIIDNNGPKSVGGGGKPRRPLAPPL